MFLFVLVRIYNPYSYIGIVKLVSHLRNLTKRVAQRRHSINFRKLKLTVNKVPSLQDLQKNVLPK